MGLLSYSDKPVEMIAGQELSGKCIAIADRAASIVKAGDLLAHGVVKAAYMDGTPIAAGSQFAIGEAFPLIVSGACVCVASAAVALGEQVYMDSAHKATNVATANTIVAGARFISVTTGADELVKISL